LATNASQSYVRGLRFVTALVTSLIDDVQVIDDGLDQGDVDLVDQVDSCILDSTNGTNLRMVESLKWVICHLLRRLDILLKGSVHLFLCKREV
jgi:hypothetical protein